MRRNVIKTEQPFFFYFTNQAFHFSLPLSASSSPSDNIPRSPSGNEVEIHDELRPHNQKITVSVTFTLDRTCLAFWGPGDVFETHCEDWSFVLTA